MNAWTSVLVAFTDNDRTTDRSWRSWLYACQSLVWAQWPSRAMYQLSLWQMCVLANLEYLSILFCAVFWAAAPGLVAVLPMWDSAYVSGTVTSQAIGFPLANAREWSHLGVCCHPASGWLALWLLASGLAWSLATGCHSNDCDVVVWERFCGTIVHAAHVHPLALLLLFTLVLNSQGMKKLRYAIKKSTKIKLEWTLLLTPPPPIITIIIIITNGVWKFVIL